MKKILILIYLLVVASCSNIYSPNGIQGKDAKKEIRDLVGNLGIINFPLLLSSGASSSFVCPTESTAIIGSNNASTAANFTLPGQNAYVDLSSTGGTLHFRSNANSSTTTIFSVRILQTANTLSSATCTYTSSGICAGAIGTGISIFTTASVSVSASECLAIRCTNAAYIRIQQLASATIPTTTTTSFFAAILAPDLLDSVSGIEDDKYYTKDSFEKCKEGVTNISLIQSSFTSSAFSGLREVSNCNKPASAVPQTVDSTTAAVLQGNECKLEEVNFIGF
ncbi:MAG: small lipoprotein [Leptospira sp.]|nr:small lipoprotein [Leptospira sp.]